MKKFIVTLGAIAFTLSLPFTAFAHGHGTPKYKVCAIENCAVGYTHEHYGAFYLSHRSNDGHKYHSSSSHWGGRR